MKTKFGMGRMRYDFNEAIPWGLSSFLTKSADLGHSATSVAASC